MLLRNLILKIYRREGNVALYDVSAALPERSVNGTESRIQNRKLGE